MKRVMLGLAVAGYMASMIVPSFAKCPAGTSYQCSQGFNGKVICGCR